jgi:DNA-binding protein H-NS
MTKIDLKSKCVEELHEEIAAILLSAKIEAEKLKLEQRLERIERKGSEELLPYPKVHPRFRNPDPPHETWSGPGLQPGWVRILLANTEIFR